ncbi:aminodeoxychorismate lyase [Novilysobacter erysipheiresistens]
MAPDNAAASPEGPGRESWIFVGERRAPAIAPDDRALAYGDGLFETMRACRGEVAWWDAHWSRLERGAARLGLALPSQARVRREAGQLLHGRDGVLKLQLSRGSGGRGYAPPLAPEPTWILSRHPLPSSRPAGLTLRWCDTRLALQPALAGIKHCNRLEQVLARAEWQIPGAIDGDADEGLMRSTDGDVVCATAANLFVLHGERWRTPPVDRCGVAGVCRQWLFDRFEIEQAPLSVADVETADAIVLTNAVRGILPVAQLGSLRWAAHPRVAEWRRCLAEANPAFAEPCADPSNPPEMP